MIRHLDDSKQINGYVEQGATVIKGAARISGPGAVDVNGRSLSAKHIIVATGSDAAVPPVDGLDTVPVWTNREATSLREIPDRVVMVGGSAVGTELGQFLHRFGARVTIVERSAALLFREEPRVGEILGERLRAEGIDVRTSATATEVRRDGADTVITLDDGTVARCDVVVVGTGRTPRTADLGLDTIGVTLGDKGQIRVDEHCQAADGLWAIGDVTAIMPFSHVAKYQARIATDTILGRPRAASYQGIPRVVFTDPEVAAVGLTRAQPDRQGLRIRPLSWTSTLRLPAPGPTSKTLGATSGCLPTPTRVSCSVPGPSPRWPANGSTRPPWPSAPASRSRFCSTRSRSSPPTARVPRRAGGTRPRPPQRG